MEKSASEITKEGIRQIEEQANELLVKCDVVTLASINKSGYPRICTIAKVKAGSM